jgi:hypothetical protein
VTVTVDSCLLAHFDDAAGDLEITPRRYTIKAGANAGEVPLKPEVTLAAAQFKPDRGRLG